MTFKPIQLPEDLVNDIIQHSQAIDDNYWWLGDITNRIFFIMGGTYTHDACADAVAYNAKWRKETVRDQAWMSRKIPPAKREYNLSRHQYKATLAAGDNWEKYAKMAEQYADEHFGHTAHISQIRDWIKGSTDEVPVWRKRLDRLIHAAKVLFRDEDTPEEIKLLVKDVAEYGG